MYILGKISQLEDFCQESCKFVTKLLKSEVFNFYKFKLFTKAHETFSCAAPVFLLISGLYMARTLMIELNAL